MKYSKHKQQLKEIKQKQIQPVNLTLVPGCHFIVTRWTFQQLEDWIIMVLENYKRLKVIT